MTGSAFPYVDATMYVMGSFDPVSGHVGPCYTLLELSLGVQPGSLRSAESWTAADLLFVAALEPIRGLRQRATPVA